MDAGGSKRTVPGRSSKVWQKRRRSGAFIHRSMTFFRKLNTCPTEFCTSLPLYRGIL